MLKPQQKQYKNILPKLGLVIHVYNPSSQETEADGLLQIQG